jgi:nitroreductase
MSSPSRGVYKPAPFAFNRATTEEQLRSLREFLESMKKRRSVRFFSPDDVPFELIENAIYVASLAPSGANQQPWRFVVVRDLEIKRRIRETAEIEEKQSYTRRMPAEWLTALAPLGTDWRKEFLEIAPCLIVVFRIDYGVDNGNKIKHYYVQESVGIASGFLLAALHMSGLVTLTHTPSPMGFLGDILERPKNERPFLLIPVGYPAANATVPEIGKKEMKDILIVK